MPEMRWHSQRGLGMIDPPSPGDIPLPPTPGPPIDDPDDDDDEAPGPGRRLVLVDDAAKPVDYREISVTGPTNSVKIVSTYHDDTLKDLKACALLMLQHIKKGD